MLRVHVHPGARREGVQGYRGDGSLKLEVTERPEDGRANHAVTRLLAESLGVPAGAVRVVRGAAARAKVVAIEGLTEAEVRERLAPVEGERP